MSLHAIRILEHPRFAVQGDGDSQAQSNVRAIAPQYDDQACGVFLPLAPELDGIDRHFVEIGLSGQSMDIPKRMGIASIRLQDVIGLRGGFQGKGEETAETQQPGNGLKDCNQVSGIDEYVGCQHQVARLLAFAQIVDIVAQYQLIVDIAALGPLASCGPKCRSR